MIRKVSEEERMINTFTVLSIIASTT
ncbi:Protein of unknown function [Bacillus cytotoxicus]|uniref:Uncharacterized protein n=1 Tax=Bacillus cytotoxicus TaxID=580165 RepID=A0AAX2CFR8_9BACI|nr:Protein of unknown function [Bacillus cytotoxicus]SCN34952.1 Protein of unknown function [Bacillus cytotoxicus]